MEQPGSGKLELAAHEREYLRVLRQFAEIKRGLMQTAQREFQEAEQLLRAYVESLGRARGLEGDGWSIAPDLSAFLRLAAPRTSVASSPLSVATDNGQGVTDNEIQNS